MLSTKISAFVARLVVAALAAIESFFISKIKSQVVQKGIRLSLAPVQQTVIALGDDNPRNEEQVEAIWKKFANQDLANFSEDEVSAALDKIQDVHIRTVLEALSRPTIGLLRVVTDEDVHDGEQIKALFTVFIQSKETQAIAIEHVVIPLLVEKIKDEGLRNFIIEFLKGSLDGGE